MAPNRRKGAGKAAAAACLQWKVDDLVLAKVKGFPAWPAVVSEAGKWGLPVDRKKVFVYFFGTQQIAFCNPADVEAFTEEKKVNLLGKRHGKGADFVRAVREIVDSFEKLKSKDQGDNVPSTDEVTMTNGNNSVESLADSVVKDEAPKAINGTYPESSDSTKAKCDDDFPVRENLAATTQVPSHDREEAPLENSTVNTNVEEAPQPTTYSRKKYGATQAQNFVTHKIVPSARRSRNSSRVDSRKLQSFVMLPSRNIRKGSGNVSRYGLRDASSRRSKRVRKSPDVSEVNDVDSPAFVSSGSHEENGSGTDTDDSDSISYNDGSTVESGYGRVQTASAVEFSEGDTELNQRLDFQSSSIIVKKKRKPSRKRSHSGANEFTGRLEKERESEIEEHKSEQSLPNDIKDAKENYINEDGDEHLPLLKRARVRMGRPSSEVVEPESSAQPEEKSSEVSDRAVRLNVNSGEDSPVDRLSSVNDTDNLSMVNKFRVNKPPLWEVKKQFGCSIDGEADLPPSKRIHRALEAMSANVAEDVEATFEEPSTKTSMSASCFFVGDSSNVLQNNKLEGKTILHTLGLAFKNSAQDAISGCSTDSAPLIINEGPSSNIKVAAPLVIHDSPKPTSCSDGVAVQAVDCSDCHGIFSLIKPESETEVLPERTKSLSPAVDRKVNTYEGSEEDILQPSTDNHQIENPDLEQPVDPSRISRKNLDTVPANIEILNGSTQDDACLSPCNLQANFETSNMLKLDMDKGENKDNGMFMVKGEPTLKDSKADFSPTRDAKSSLQGPHMFQSDSHSEDHLNHKAVSGIRLSSSPTLALGPTARAPPDNNSSCNISGSDDSVPFANNSCCNRDIPLTHEKPKSSGKQNGKVEAGAALASFENLLGLLTRTKDSIGRATRSAIECAKHGLASKVVEVLARNLEREPNLHKRVDLFFLVDSITQCSRGLKGEVGGVYPSAIQSVLPRLLLAAAPPGSNGRENRRQCLKVLRLWQDRRVLPESVIRRHIRDLDSASNPVSAGPFCRRLQRTERAFDDPLREVEGMVDEYGSNSSFQLPGFRMPPMLKDEDDGRDSDGEGFEAVTPEHCSDNPGARLRIDANEKRSHILEAVDGELEMEDVSPSCEAELSSTSNGRVHSAEVLHHRFEQGFPVISGPPLPKDVPPSSPPLPMSPPPPPHQSLPPAPPPPPPPPPPPALPLAPQPPLSALPELVTSVLDSKFYKKEDKQQFIAQHPVATRIDPITTDAAPYRVPENRDLKLSTQVPESVNSGSYSSLPASHPPVQQLNNVPQVDGAISQNKTLHMRSQVPESVKSCSFGGLPVSRPPIRHGNSVPQVDGAISQNKAFHLRPPHPAPSNQFSYVQATDHRTQTREIPPQSYPDGFHYVQNRDRGNVFSDHDRFESASHDAGDNWRHPERSFSGPSYHDRGRLPYAPGPYGCPPREAPIQDRGWAYPPRGMNHREFMSHRRPLDGPIPVASRGPNYWRPR